MRVCKTCKVQKDICEFYKVKQSKDGISLHCKCCTKLKYNVWKEKYKKKHMNHFTRNCPKCGKVLNYSSKAICKLTEELKGLCRSCSAKQHDVPDAVKIRQTKGLFTGENATFYGKKHTNESRLKISKNTNRDHMKTQEYKEKISKATKGNKNPMFGKSVYSVWVTKYGTQKADELMVDYKQKQSVNNSGKKNKMYGKPSPTGSGNGWSGWYGDFYFRSLKELSYVIGLDNQKIKWGSAEKIKIPYQTAEGVDRTYCPDFLVGNKLIEVKPKKLWNTLIVITKKKYAIDYCEKNNLIYELIDPVVLDRETIKSLRMNGQIKFIDRYEEKFQQMYCS